MSKDLCRFTSDYPNDDPQNAAIVIPVNISMVTEEDEPLGGNDLFTDIDSQRIAHMIEAGTLCGTFGEAVWLDRGTRTPLLFVGCDRPGTAIWRPWDSSEDVLRALAFGFAVRAARSRGMKRIVVECHNMARGAAVFARTCVRANYRYETELIEPPTKAAGSPIEEIVIVGTPYDDLIAELRRGEVIGRASNWGRTLMNRPASDLTSSVLLQEAEALVVGNDAIVAQAFGPRELDELGFDLTLAVAAASNQERNPPGVIILEHRGDPDSEFWVALDGKGVVKDTGGKNMKKDDSDMHMDMGGAARVLATFKAAVELNLPINLVCGIFAVENSVGPNMTTSGTPVKSRMLDGTVVNILNTDAEGRLGLVELARYLAKHYQLYGGADSATLTGFQALAHPGSVSTLTTTHGDEWQTHLMGLDHGERFQVMLASWEAWKDLQDSGGLYQMANIGTRKGGSITLEGHTQAGEFVLQAVTKPTDLNPNGVRWSHQDQAATTSFPKDNGEFAKGADCYGVATLLDLLEAYWRQQQHSLC